MNFKLIIEVALGEGILKLFAITWNCLKSLEIAWNCLKLLEIAWNCLQLVRDLQFINLESFVCARDVDYNLCSTGRLQLKKLTKQNKKKQQ